MQSQRPANNPGLKTIFGPGAETGVLSLDAIRRRAQRQLSKFDSEAREELQQLDIEVPPGIGLLGCPQCSLILEGEHPQSQALRQWLDGNTRIVKRFKEVEVLFEMLRAIEAPGQIAAAASCFHIGLTRAGPVAYFQDHSCSPSKLPS
jgi:hypothetical protein